MIKKNWKKIILAIIIVGIIAIYFLNPTINNTVNYAISVLMSGNIDKVVSYIRSYGNIAAVVSFLLMVLQSIISPIPAFLITFANAMISSATGSSASLVYDIILVLFMKASTPRGEKNLAVPFVGRTWLGPAK